MKGVVGILQNWRRYKYRFVPWLALNWIKNSKSVRRIAKSEDYVNGQDAKLSDNLKSIFEAFELSEKSNASQVLFEKSGFNIGIRSSSISNAGNGVFVTKGSIPNHTIAAMYPGTIYYPSDPIFIQSISNQFILRCIDGLLVDGNRKGISKSIYRSCSRRDVLGPYEPCDTSWLMDSQRNPLAIGQYVNNQTSISPANVAYQEVDLLASFPLYLRKYLPNIYFRSKFLEEHASTHEEHQIWMRVVVLISLKEIRTDEELFSAYFTEVF